jgi:hypothetical protein
VARAAGYDIVEDDRLPILVLQRHDGGLQVGPLDIQDDRGRVCEGIGEAQPEPSVGPGMVGPVKVEANDVGLVAVAECNGPPLRVRAANPPLAVIAVAMVGRPVAALGVPLVEEGAAAAIADLEPRPSGVALLVGLELAEVQDEEAPPARVVGSHADRRTRAGVRFHQGP